MPAHAVLPLTLVRTAGLPLDVPERFAGDFSAAISAVQEAERLVKERAETLQQAFDRALAGLPESPERTSVYNARKVFFQKQKLKVGALPPDLPDLFGAARLWEQAQQSLVAARQGLHDRYEAVLHASSAALTDLASSEILQKGLLFASHDLLAQIPVFQNIAPGQYHKKQRQTAFSLAQYVVRAATKTSPFSRFTTLSALSDAAENEDIWTAGKAVVTPNVGMLPLLYEVLLTAPSFYRNLNVALNPSLCAEPPASPAQHFKWLYFDGEQESFQRTPATPLLGFLVEKMNTGAQPLLFGELLTQLEDVLDAPPEARERFLLDLLDLGLLEWQWPERGLSPSWCGNLYQFLGFLPDAEPLVVEAAALLQWLRGAARTLPFQRVPEARATQHEAVRQLRDFLENHGFAAPDIPAEQIFYEDVELPAETALPPEVLQNLAGRLADCWQEKPKHAASALKSRLWKFASERFEAAPPPDFLRFCEEFLRTAWFEKHGSGYQENLQVPRFQGKIGALLQIFKEQGEWRAVVNGLFPGGGKLMARWLHLLPPGARAALDNWWPDGTLAFPWQGWHNANFQPGLGQQALSVPGSRRSGPNPIPLARLHVQAGPEGIRLTDGPSGASIRFSDLGLEAPETRPPAMQVLAELGLPRVSRELLLPEPLPWTEGGPGWRFCRRIEYGPLVLERAQWQIALDGLRQNLPPGASECFFLLREKLEAMAVPRRFFARFSNEKPQFFDQNSPLLMQLFTKKIRQHDGEVVLSEMLPLPDQCFVRQDGALHAAEFVVELEVF